TGVPASDGDRRSLTTLVGSRLALVGALVLAGACSVPRSPAPAPSAGERVVERATAPLYDPAADLGALFHDVQLARVFDDSKTFVDARPLEAPAVIAARYLDAQDDAGFDLARFVERNFAVPAAPNGAYTTDSTRSMEQHIRALWPVLTRAADSAHA